MSATRSFLSLNPPLPPALAVSPSCGPLCSRTEQGHPVSGSGTPVPGLLPSTAPAAAVIHQTPATTVPRSGCIQVAVCDAPFPSCLFSSCMHLKHVKLKNTSQHMYVSHVCCTCLLLRANWRASKFANSARGGKVPISRWLGGLWHGQGRAGSDAHLTPMAASLQRLDKASVR